MCLRKRCSCAQLRDRGFCVSNIVGKIKHDELEKCFLYTEFAHLRVFQTQMSQWLKHKSCSCATGFHDRKLPEVASCVRKSGTHILANVASLLFIPGRGTSKSFQMISVMVSYSRRGK